ncbi:hypothetical protein ABDJ41_08250 [Pedobacter sp. ASV1-7]|uniref:hypothetical protein n=1 Tax=Pedobacter sp. ASV1-7 TaxID=3145237 RepID=UPI0032E88117
MTIKTINTPSIIQSFLRLGTNLLKIRSEIKAITAVNKQKPANSPVTLTWLLYPDGFFSNSTNAATTRDNAETIFSGVNFTFNSV